MNDMRSRMLPLAYTWSADLASPLTLLSVPGWSAENCLTLQHARRTTNSARLCRHCDSDIGVQQLGSPAVFSCVCNKCT
jgi:hypothetical protein